MVYLDACVVSCNENTEYLDFWSSVKKVWKELVHIDCKMILVADDIPSHLRDDPDVIHFTPVPNVHTAFQAQVIRLLYPALLKQYRGIVISDMDMIPMCKWYYHDSVKDYSEDTLICYRDVLQYCRQYPMCYNMASPKTWGEVFHIQSVEDIRNFLSYWGQVPYDGKHGGMGWFTDQLITYKYFGEFKEKYPDRFVGLKDETTNFRRLDRIDRDILNLSVNRIEEIIEHKYCDFHMLRPYHQYKSQNDKIVEWVLTNS